MNHGREDYNERIQDSAGIIPDDEPVFLLRARDSLAPMAVDCWIAHHVRDIGDCNKIASLQAHADAMRAWQKEHGVKIADTPNQDLNPRMRYALAVNVIGDPMGVRIVEFDTETARQAYIDEHNDVSNVSLVII